MDAHDKELAAIYADDERIPLTKDEIIQTYNRETNDGEIASFGKWVEAFAARYGITE